MVRHVGGKFKLYKKSVINITGGKCVTTTNKVMPFVKTVSVTEIRSVQKVDSGEFMYQVVFSENLNATAVKPSGEKIKIVLPAIWLTINVEKHNIARYPISSTWKITIDENSTITLVEQQ